MPSSDFICSICFKTKDYPASLAEIGYWAVVPEDSGIDIHPSCGECAFHDHKCGVDMHGRELACAGNDFLFPVPSLEHTGLSVVLTHDFRLHDKNQCTTGA